MAINKVVYGNRTIIDLTNDTVTVSDVVSGVTFHLKDGTTAQGNIQNGDSLEYGLTDGTQPLAGVAKAGSAVIEGEG